MKRFLTAVMLVFGAMLPAMAQYTNSTPFSSPPSPFPQIDSTNFVNLSSFFVSSPVEAPLTFSDVLYYTNRSELYCSGGFTFEDQPASSGTNRPSSVFGNSSQGTIYAGAGTSVSYNFIYFDQGVYTFVYSPSLTIWATNVVNAGFVDAGAPGVISITGNSVNLDRGTLQIEGFSDYSTVTSNNIESPQIGIFDYLYGIGFQTNVLTASTFDPSSSIGVISPASTITIVGGLTLTNFYTVFLQKGAAEGFAWYDNAGVSNRTIEAVLVNTNNPGISVDVRRNGGGPGFGFGIPCVRWQAVITNGGGLPTITNAIYLEDEFGFYQTNFYVTNGYTLSGIPQLAPYNYAFTRVDPGFASFNTNNFVPYDAQTLFAGAFNFGETNAYSAYEVNVQPVSYQQDPTTEEVTLTNVPGRIAITATGSLDLTLSKISGPNYLNISSTNHFVGANNADIVTPYMDLNLGSTNGSLTISNLISPYVPRFNGTIELYSCRWTNVDSTGYTNTYHVLIADAALSPTSDAGILNLSLRSTNVSISDVLNIESNATVSATALTITTNVSTALNSTGEVNLLYPSADWSTAFSNLQYLTNNGFIDVGSPLVLFTGFSLGIGNDGSATFYDSSPNTRPYAAFVNHGTIESGSMSIWASYAESSSPTAGGALLEDVGGTFSLQSSNALLYNDTIISSNGDVAISVNNLSISNQAIYTGGAITFTFVTNGNLSDGGRSSTNYFQASDGLNLLSKPATGDFLDSVINLAAPASQVVYNTWAASDRGINPAGFHNNAALGHLILSGGDAYSQFYFSGPDTNRYALYVDLLDLQNGATNRSNSGGSENFNAFAFGATNFTIYFADAVIGNNDISEKLNGANGGQLVWVPAYAGRFSSTNLVYPAGVTNTFNRALVLSTDIDSDADGIVNAFDLTPIYTANSVNFSIGFTNVPARAPVLHWNLLGDNASNLVYYKTNLASTNWTLLTNITTSGFTVPNYTFVDRGRTNSTVYYKLQIDAVQP